MRQIETIEPRTKRVKLFLAVKIELFASLDLRAGLESSSPG
jgi:hypothetical protein